MLHYGLSVAAQKLHEPDEALVEGAPRHEGGQERHSRAQSHAHRVRRRPHRRDKRKAVEDARSAVDRFPLSTMIAENYVDSSTARTSIRSSFNFLRSNTAISQESSNYHALLARSYEKLGKKSLQYLHTGEMYALYGSTERPSTR